MDRQSSLPSSLIPHLYSAPRNSSTRTTLANDRHPSYNFPPPPPLVPPRSSWREGEAGPSYSARHTRPTNYPTRVPSHFDTFGRRNTAFEPFADLTRRDQDRDSYLSFSQRMFSPRFLCSFFFLLIPLPATAYSHQPLPPLIPPLDEPSFSFDRHDAYSYPPMGSLSISPSAPSSAHFTSPESPDIHSTYRAETRSLDFGSNDEESSHKPKRRRQQSLDTDDNSRKSRNPRKTAVACNFCRGSSIFINPHSPGFIFFQVANYAATVQSLPVTTVPSASSSANMSQSNAAEVQARPQREADPNEWQLKHKHTLVTTLYPPLLLI